MNVTTPCLWSLCALNNISRVPPTAMWINALAADRRMHTASRLLFDEHATRARTPRHIETASANPIAPVPRSEHALAVALLRAFPGVSAAAGALYRHIRDTPGMSREEQESLQALLAEPYPLLEYRDLARSLIAGLTTDAPEDHDMGAAAREVIVGRALRDVQGQPHPLAMMIHSDLLQRLVDKRLLQHVRAAARVAHIRDMQRGIQPAGEMHGQDIRTQVLLAEPVRDALLMFLLAEAGA